MAVYVDTVGFLLNVSVTKLSDGSAIDISPANGILTLDVRKPDGTAATWTPAITSGPSGQATYTTVAGDLDQVGTYCIQGNWDPTGDSNLWSESFTLTVRNRP